MHGLRSQARPPPRTPTERAIETLFEIGLAFHRGEEYTFDPEFYCQGMDKDEMNRIVNAGLITESKMHFVAEGYKHLIAWRRVQDIEMFDRLRQLEPESFRLATEPPRPDVPRAGTRGKPTDNGDNVNRIPFCGNGGDTIPPVEDQIGAADTTPINDGQNDVPEQTPADQQAIPANLELPNENVGHVTQKPPGDGVGSLSAILLAGIQTGGAQTTHDGPINATEQSPLPGGIGTPREVPPHGSDRSIGGPSPSPSRSIVLDHADLEAHMRALGLWRDRRPPRHRRQRDPSATSPQRPTNNAFGDIAPNQDQRLQSPATVPESRSQNPQTKIRLVRATQPEEATGSLLDIINRNPIFHDLSPIRTPAQSPGLDLNGGSFDVPAPAPNDGQSLGRIIRAGSISNGSSLENTSHYPPRPFKTLREMIEDDNRSLRNKVLRMKPVVMPPRQPQTHPELELDDMNQELNAHYQIIFDAARNGTSDIPFTDFVHGSDAERLRQERALVAMISDGVIELVDNQTKVRIIQPTEESSSDHSSTDDEDVDLQEDVGGRDDS